MSARTARLDTRITPELQLQLKRAAEIEGRSISDFVAAAAQMAAQKTIEQATIVRLALQDQEAFAAALIDPPAANDRLRSAFAKHRQQVTSE